MMSQLDQDGDSPNDKTKPEHQKNSISMVASKEQNQSKATKFKAFNFEKRTSTKYSMPLSHFDGYNLWLLKPTHLNRGRGIHVFRDLESMHKLIKEYCKGKDEETKGSPKKEVNNLNQDT